MVVAPDTDRIPAPPTASAVLWTHGPRDSKGGRNTGASNPRYEAVSSHCAVSTLERWAVGTLTGGGTRCSSKYKHDAVPSYWSTCARIRRAPGALPRDRSESDSMHRCGVGARPSAAVHARWSESPCVP